MLDVNDFIKERGGDPGKIKESQRRRYAPVEVVDEVIALFEDARKSSFLCLLLRKRVTLINFNSTVRGHPNWV